MRGLLEQLDGEGVIEDRIRPCQGGLFEPDPEGMAALIVGVADFGPTYDACAFRPADPARWWLAMGSATILGARALRKAAFHGHAVDLVALPLTWLRRTTIEGDVAACILSWNMDPRLTLGWVRQVRCESEALRHRLEQALARHARPPFTVSVARHAGVKRHAA